MSEQELLGAIEQHDNAVAAMGDALAKGDEDGFISATVGFLVALASDVPLVGTLAKQVTARAFGKSANAILRRQIAEWEVELDRQAFIARLSEAVEALIGQALIQLIRSQQNVKAEVLDALGGIRKDLAEFRDEFGRCVAEANVRIEHELIDGGATGVRLRVSANSRKVVWIRQERVTGAGTIGVELDV